MPARDVPRMVLLLFLLAAMPTVARAQFLPGVLSPGGPQAGVINPDTISPRDAVRAFVESWQQWTTQDDAAARDRAMTCLDLSSLGRVLFGESRYEAASRFGRLLRHFNAPGALDQLPDAEAVRGAAGSTTRLNLSDGTRSLRVDVDRGRDGAWRISGRSIDAAEPVYDAVFGHESSLALLLRGMGLNALVDRRFIGLALYTWAALFVLIVLGVATDILVRAGARAVVRRWLRGAPGAGTPMTAPGDMVTRTVRPLGLLGGSLLVYWLLGALDLPLQAESILRTAVKAFALIAGVWTAYRVVDLAAEAYRHRPGVHADPGMEGLLVPLVSRAVKLFILALGLVFIAESLNLPITSLVAGVSLAGAAVAIAAKGTLENIFGTFTVILDKPFRVGDWVKIEGVEGSVEDISFRSTRVRTFNDSLVTIPNAVVMRAAVDNFGMRALRRYLDRVVLTPDTGPPAIETFCQAVRRRCAAHPAVDQASVQVHAHDFTYRGIEVRIAVLISAPDFPAELQVRHEVMLGVIESAKQVGVEFARGVMPVMPGAVTGTPG